jgi:hypothetical protein
MGGLDRCTNAPGVAALRCSFVSIHPDLPAVRRGLDRYSCETRLGRTHPARFCGNARRCGTSPLFAVLVGGNEVSAVGQASAGDPDGRGSATIIILPASRTLCFATLVTGIDTPVAAHVYRALPGRNGPIVVTLTPPVNGNPGTSSGCVANLDPALLAAIERNPGLFTSMSTPYKSLLGLCGASYSKFTLAQRKHRRWRGALLSSRPSHAESLGSARES